MNSTSNALTGTCAYLAERLETVLENDVLGLVGPILPGAEHALRAAIEEQNTKKRARLAVVLHTGGGLVEVVERIVSVIRKHYAEVTFIVPDVAMSAGTILAMSGDAIMMDYFSCLGPIDPQVQRDGKLVPALSYLVQYNRLLQKAASGSLNTAEYAMLTKFDLAELHQFEEARELSTSLLVRWLANYKFKDWVVTAGTKQPVDQTRRELRAKEIAEQLSDHERWHSHGRGIPMDVLRKDLNLRIDDFGEKPEVSAAIREYHGFLLDYMNREGLPFLAHTPRML